MEPMELISARDAGTYRSGHGEGRGADPTRSHDDTLAEGFETRPIYQLPPYFIAWELGRSDAKILAKSLAETFQTKEEGKVSKKPIGVKPGKGRRHGGYGIG
jgi:hypothetical protein